MKETSAKIKFEILYHLCIIKNDTRYLDDFLSATSYIINLLSPKARSLRIFSFTELTYAIYDICIHHKYDNVQDIVDVTNGYITSHKSIYNMVSRHHGYKQHVYISIPNRYNVIVNNDYNTFIENVNRSNIIAPANR